MDYNSHHSLHYDTHIPIHHCTNHTTVTNHSLTLIVSPHLHLIHTHTYKQHTSLHSPRSLVLPRLTFWAFPLYSVFLDCLYTLTVCCLPFDPACLSISSLSAACPDLCIAPVADSALPTWHLLLPLTLACLTLPCSLKLHLDLNATDSSHYNLVNTNPIYRHWTKNSLHLILIQQVSMSVICVQGRPARLTMTAQHLQQGRDICSFVRLFGSMLDIYVYIYICL